MTKSEMEKIIEEVLAAAFFHGRQTGLEEGAKVAKGEIYKERYRKWAFWSGNRADDSSIVKFADDCAAAIRSLKDKEDG